MAPIKRNKYTNDLKYEVIREVAKGTKRSDIIRKYGISTNTLVNWIKNKDAIIGSLTCVTKEAKTARKRNMYTNELKYEVIQEVAKGNKRSDIKVKYGISTSTLTNWVKHKESIAIIGSHTYNLNTPTRITGDIYIEMDIQGEVLATCEEENSIHSENVGLPILDDLSNCLSDINKNSLLYTQDIRYLQTQILDNLLGDKYYPQLISHQDKFLIGITDITVDDSNSPNELSCSQQAMLQDLICRAECMGELN